MGYQTTVIIFNDFLDKLNDPQFSKLLKQDIGQWWLGQPYPISRNEYKIVAQDHADLHRLMVVGNYDGVTLSSTHDATNTEEHQQAMQIKLLREAASKLGFKLTKRKRKQIPLEDPWA